MDKSFKYSRKLNHVHSGTEVNNHTSVLALHTLHPMTLLTSLTTSLSVDILTLLRLEIPDSKFFVFLKVNEEGMACVEFGSE